MTSNWAWRLPVILQAVPSLIVVAFVWLLPESPRWLVSHGKTALARDVLIKYHGDGDPYSAVAALELSQIQESLDCEAELSDKRWWDYRPLFNCRPALYRIWLVMLVTVFSQFIGGSVIR
jgi:MFS family permease